MDELEALTREELVEIILELRQQVAALQKQVQELRAQLPGGGGGAGAPVPSFVKANRPPKADKERKKRSQSFVRRKETPTQVHLHAPACCRDCGHALCGGWEHRRRQIIEIAPTPVSIIDHVLVARHCGVCNKRCLPQVDLSEQVVGRHRVGVRLMSLVAYLHTVGRLPLRTLQRVLGLLYNLHLSVGEISHLLHTVAASGKSEQERLLERVRSSPFVNADETGWREDGQNGYLWTFTTPAVRYFVYNQSRGGQVPVEALGQDFAGVTVSDFYGGYNGLLGLHQRCWVHLLRDLHALTEKHPAAAAWVSQVRAVYDRAKAWQPPALPSVQAVCRARQAARLGFEEAARVLARPYLSRIGYDLGQEEAPERVLAQRLMRFASELFTFVEHPEVPSDNNAAERSLRPCVIARKISGGTRSAKGSSTKATLLSLFGTWLAQGKDPWQACQQMLVARAP